MSIEQPKSQLKIKVAIFVFLVAFLSYGMGYLMGKDTNRTPIIIEKISE